ncbi:MAG: RNA-splicing factor [Heterodermia speciosa]|uniref:RNA-splicing factor n=1 Tax=Heterodermia speciosa TaxID=116794 RepID=A0A8H3IFB5_9LECA|nr:MAG: RNA-splicing factor [Heterodermia speciosa]
MSSNVGLSTPRGSGTSGYVQRNLSNLKPRDNFAPYPKDFDLRQHRQRQPDKDILNHDRLREIEVKVFDLRDKLEDEGVDEEEIEMQTEALRKKLTAGSAEGGKNAGRSQLKPHQVHELAAAKIEESEKLRKALGIREDYEEGSHWKKQEERLRDGTEEKIKEER